jgi:hypothetical protein
MENSLKVSLYTSQAKAAAEQNPRWTKGNFHTSLGNYMKMFSFLSYPCSMGQHMRPRDGSAHTSLVCFFILLEAKQKNYHWCRSMLKPSFSQVRLVLVYFFWWTLHFLFFYNFPKTSVWWKTLFDSMRT